MSSNSESSSSTPQKLSPSTMAPVFVFPDKLTFYNEDVTTHKQVLSIYNPYDVDVRFKVLSNNPAKYAVVEPEGTISAQKCSDTVVRHVAISPNSLNQSDKFRICIYDMSGKEAMGRRDIVATLKPGLPSEEEKSHSLPHKRKDNYKMDQFKSNMSQDPSMICSEIQDPIIRQPNFVVCFAAIVCITCLFLPTEGEGNTSYLFANYPWLHLSPNLKLVFAYVLGLVTMAILKP